jgi:4-amino-4-deoxy-L-arabinose transferase-like glycosyltransferase
LEEPREAQEKAAPGRLAFVPASSLIYIAIGLLLGLAVLAKGPIGFLLPAASLGLFLLLMNAPVPATRTCKDASKPHSKVWLQTRGFLAQLAATLSPRNFLGVVRSMRPLTVLAVALLVAAPWFVLVAVKTDGQWLEEFVTKFNLRPFASPFLGHRGPFFYHFLVVLVGLFPWSVFLGPTVVNAWREIRGRGRETPCYVFLVCWIGLFFGFWSVCSTKLPHYVLPAYPALAILTACFLDAWLKRREVAARYVMPTATAIFLAVGLLMLVLLPWIAARYAPGEEIIALVGLGLFPGGCAAMYFLFRDRRRAYLATIAASSLLFIILFFSWAELRVDRHQHSRPLMAALHGDSPAAPQIAGYKYCDPSTIYYAGGPVARFDDADELRGFIERSSHPYVVTTENDRKVLESQMPGQWRLVARRPRFLSKGDIVVLAPRLRSPEVGRCEEAMRQGNGETFRK